MKVLQFIPSLNVFDGGTTTYMQQLAPALGQLCELHVCALGNVEDFVKIEGCQLHAVPNGYLHWFKMRRAWKSLLNELQPDIVHINCCWMPQIAWVFQWTMDWRKHNHDCSIFLTPHGMLEPWIIRQHYWTRKMPAICLYQRAVIRGCDMIIATAAEEKEHILKLGWNPQVKVVQNGIDVDHVRVKANWRRTRQLLFMSRIHPKKGLELLLKALSQMNRNALSPTFRLKIAGEGDPVYVNQLKQLTVTLNLQQIVTFVGPIYGEEKWQLIRDADVVVLPSYSENYGLIIAESLASGTPVITTTGTPWKSVNTYRCGWWVNPDISSLQKALTDLSSLDSYDLETMGRNARTLAETNCSVSAKVCELYQLYLSKPS